MLNVGTPEMLVILVVALLVLGPNKLPEVARQVGKAVGEIRRLGAGNQADMRDAKQEPGKVEPLEPPDLEPESAPGGIAPGWSPDDPDDLVASNPADDEDDEPPAGIAPV
ncbi:MAG: twin-arginine translocation protein tatb [Actinomycetia bacterium]|nr:twin-arginine translocation protein tatb [Actinomycetes bacterium]